MSRARRHTTLSLLVVGPVVWLAGIGVALDDTDMIRIAVALTLVAAAALIVATRIAPAWSARDSSSGSRSSIA